MSDHLWRGAELKLSYAVFHFTKMSDCLQPPRDAYYAAQVAAGSLVGAGSWRQSLEPHLDALLAATRSVPEIVQCCFGYDRHPRLEPWWLGLSADEQDRRREFSKEFKPHRGAFLDLPLSHARDVS